MLIRRLLLGGDFSYHLGDANPTKSYCQQLLNFHYNRLSKTLQYRFVSHVKRLLEAEQASLEKELSAPRLGNDIGIEWEEALQSNNDMLQHGLDWLSKKSKKAGEERRRKKEDGSDSVKVDGKVQTLAYLIMIRSGLAPPLRPEASSTTQQDYIVNKTGLNADTVRRYLKTKPGGNPQYLIYTRDHKANALDYIFELLGEVDEKALNYPILLRG